MPTDKACMVDTHIHSVLKECWPLSCIGDIMKKMYDMIS